MIKALKFFCVFIFIITALVSNIWANQDKSRTLISNEYLQSSKELKKDLQIYLETLRLELYDKKYPQAYFIKSLQGQIAEFSFQKMKDIQSTEEQVFSLNQSIKSQYNANAKLKTISNEKLEMYLAKLNDLKVQLKAQNHLAPEFLSSANDESNFGMWTRFERFASSLSVVNQAIIFFTVFAGWIFLFGRRKFYEYKTAVKSVTKNVSKKEDKKLKGKKTGFESEAEEFRHLEHNKFLSLLRVDSNGVIVYSNKTFKTVFGEASLWKAFFDNNLSFDKNSPSNSNLYSSRKSSKKYLMTISEKDKKGLKTIFIQEVPSREEFVAATIKPSISTSSIQSNNDISKNKNDRINNEYNAEILSDVFEAVISKYPGLSASVNLEMITDEFDVLSSTEKVIMENIATDLVKFIYHFIKNKDIKTHVTLRFDETNKRHLVTFFVAQTTVRPEEMSAPFALGKNFTTLNKALKDLKLNHKDQELELKVKNVHQSQKTGFYVDVSFNKDVKTHVKEMKNSSSLSV